MYIKLKDERLLCEHEGRCRKQDKSDPKSTHAGSPRNGSIQKLTASRLDASGDREMYASERTMFQR